MLPLYFVGARLAHLSADLFVILVFEEKLKEEVVVGLVALVRCFRRAHLLVRCSAESVWVLNVRFPVSLWGFVGPAWWMSRESHVSAQFLLVLGFEVVSA